MVYKDPHLSDRELILAADGEVYGVAQGALATGAIAARGSASSVTRGVPTSARIANGATVEREVVYHLDKTNALRLGLRNPDLARILVGKQIEPAAGPPENIAQHDGAIEDRLLDRLVFCLLRGIFVFEHS